MAEDKILFVSLAESTRKGKKYMATLKQGDKLHKIHFGQKGAEDFTIHKDERRKAAYISRHRRENWDNILTPATWSRWLLWEHPDFEEALEGIKRRFELSSGAPHFRG